jgi:ABC-type nitrate/sulfonate/bicarbonate transport system substrate-binding protein
MNCSIRVLGSLAALAVASQVASAQPVTIRIGWNVLPVDMISIAWREPKTVGMKYHGITYIADPSSFGVGGGTQLTALAAGKVDVAMGPPPHCASC